MKSTMTCVALAGLVTMSGVPLTYAGATEPSLGHADALASPSSAQQQAVSSVGQSLLSSRNQTAGVRTITGTVKDVNGQVVVVQDQEGKEVRMFFSNQTKQFRGDKKPGDSIRAELSPGGHANSIQ